MLQTNLTHIQSEQDLQTTLEGNDNVMVTCGRMGPMCIPVYDIIEKTSAGAIQRWLLVYLSGGASTTTSDGVIYNTQGPTLPFGAGYHLRWRTDDLYTDLQSTDGANWSSMSWNGSAARNGNFVELSIPLADIGSPTSLQVHLSMINELNMNEWTWAGVPDTSFVDGYDPDYSRYYDFDLTGAVPPGSYTSLP